ncbi:MAG: ABC transporter ATP-binding protein [Deltaproteobacteria bacterium]|nr:MAG: ABC transporter ATP-binding protein [Deltaproteobacteria bacterium]
MRESGIEAAGLVKTFHARPTARDLLRGRLSGAPVPVLRGVSLRVAAGESVALLGENGAGKSTLLKCLAGLLVPTSGTARVAGLDPARDGARARRAVAYVAGDARSFSWRLSGRANLAFFAALYGLRGAAARQRVAAVLERVGLDPAAWDRPVAEYSTGMRQRLALARGYLAEPAVWLFDEPTSGLDPKGARAVLDDIAALCANSGAALVIATHSPDHARAAARRAVVLAGGHVVHDGDVDAAIETVLR